SPANKRKGPDRQAYEAKQRDVLQSDASLIEIDLLRSGERIYPTLDLKNVIDHIDPPPTYLVLVNRAWRRVGDGLDYQIFPVGLREWLPCIPVPLKREENEVPLDLQYLFQRI